MIARSKTYKYNNLLSVYEIPRLAIKYIKYRINPYCNIPKKVNTLNTLNLWTDYIGKLKPVNLNKPVNNISFNL